MPTAGKKTKQKNLTDVTSAKEAHLASQRIRELEFWMWSLLLNNLYLSNCVQKL